MKFVAGVIVGLMCVVIVLQLQPANAQPTQPTQYQQPQQTQKWDVDQFKAETQSWAKQEAKRKAEQWSQNVDRFDTPSYNDNGETLTKIEGDLNRIANNQDQNQWNQMRQNGVDRLGENQVQVQSPNINTDLPDFQSSFGD